MATAEVPDFLTVEEAGRVLRIGRTTAYEQAHLWLDTTSEGLPVKRVGGSLRVPRAQFEQHHNIRVTAIPPPSRRRRPKNADTETHRPRTSRAPGARPPGASPPRERRAACRSRAELAPP